MARRKYGEGCITTLKDGRIRLRVSNGSKLVIDEKTGEKKKKKVAKDFYGHTEKEAREKLEKWKEEQKNQTPEGYRKRLLMECIYEWLYTTKEIQLKTGSYARLVQTTETYIQPRFNIYTVEEVTPEIIQTSLVNDLIKDGKSHSTIKKAYEVLTGFYRWAIAMNKIEYNPTIAVIVPSNKQIKERQGKKPEIRYYNADERWRMHKAADAKNKYCREVNNYRFPRSHVYLFMMYTGLRLGEMLALKWSDYDEKKNTITISRNIIEYTDPITKKTVTKEQLSPKTSSSVRTLFLNLAAINELRIIKERSFNPKNPYIVANRKIGGDKDYVAPSNMRGAFKRFCDYAEVECKGFHALRHTFASLMFEQGVDIKYISEWLGHSSVTTTYNTYIHIMKDFDYDKKMTIPEIKIEPVGEETEES